MGTPNHSDLRIISYAKKGQPNLTKIEVLQLYPEQYPGLIIGDVTPLGPDRSSTLSSLRGFTVPIQVTNQSRSERYPLAFAITSGTDSSTQNVGFSLPILAPQNPSLVVEKKPHTLVDCWAGSDCSELELEAQNKLPYKITIKNISISSEDLLYNKPTEGYLNEIKTNSPPIDLNVLMKAKPITFRRVFSGFGTPQIKMRIDYEDEYGRPLSTDLTTDLQIRPNVLVIAIFLILGAVVGTFVRIDLGKLERAGVISRRQRIVFFITTFASGIVVCLVALFANIKVIVWTDQNSYSAWDPKVLFLTALVATVSGLPILYAYLKLPRPADTGSHKERRET
jgi:hypothetical protein